MYSKFIIEIILSRRVRNKIYEAMHFIVDFQFVIGSRSNVTSIIIEVNTIFSRNVFSFACLN